MTAKAILFPIILKLVRQALMWAGGMLVAKGILDTSSESNLVQYAVDAVPGLLVTLIGFTPDIWLWINKFAFIGKVETALHLPYTGVPSAKALTVASAAGTIALAVNPQSKTPVA